MAEITCPRCGSVFTSSVELPPCPHCGLQCGTVAAKLRIKSPKFGRFAFVVAWCAVSVPPFLFQVDWKYWACATLLLVLGLGWAYLSRKTRVEFHDSALALSGYTPKIGATDPAPSLLRAPETPRQWKALTALPPPRQLYWPSSARLNLSLLVIACFSIGGSLLRFAHNHQSLLHAIYLRPGLGLKLLYLVVSMIAMLVFLKRELGARTILRDGDVTIGYWNDGAYQFWTRSGQRFSRAAKIGEPHDALTDAGLVPVFYLPEEPTRSVALCSVYLRVRIPARTTAPDVTRASAPS
jgi:hypothetical protein